MVVDDYNKIWQEIYNLSEDPPFLDISRLSIPFIKLDDSEKPQDVYIGHEKFCFKDRHQDYKKLFIQEFLP